MHLQGIWPRESYPWAWNPRRHRREDRPRFRSLNVNQTVNILDRKSELGRPNEDFHRKGNSYRTLDRVAGGNCRCTGSVQLVRVESTPLLCTTALNIASRVKIIWQLKAKNEYLMTLEAEKQ